MAASAELPILWPDCIPVCSVPACVLRGLLQMAAHLPRQQDWILFEPQRGNLNVFGQAMLRIKHPFRQTIGDFVLPGESCRRALDLIEPMSDEDIVITHWPALAPGPREFQLSAALGTVYTKELLDCVPYSPSELVFNAYSGRAAQLDPQVQSQVRACLREVAQDPLLEPELSPTGVYLDRVGNHLIAIAVANPQFHRQPSRWQKLRRGCNTSLQRIGTFLKDIIAR